MAVAPNLRRRFWRYSGTRACYLHACGYGSVKIFIDRRLIVDTNDFRAEEAEIRTLFSSFERQGSSDGSLHVVNSPACTSTSPLSRECLETQPGHSNLLHATTMMLTMMMDSFCVVRLFDSFDHVSHVGPGTFSMVDCMLAIGRIGSTDLKFWCKKLASKVSNSHC